ncbi:MAG: inositol monophosphatase [Actinobacteria bacterium]|nr:inositol monophosphatase [Actinomycetota bacterium]
MAYDSAELLALAERAALLGGAVVRSSLDETAARTKGSAGDYVTAVDRRSEEAIGALLARETPEIPMVGEEEGGPAGDRYWSVDPLDGTTNFVHGFKVVAVSVALVERGRPTVGVVHGPLLAETYAASTGKGAWRRSETGETERIRVSARAPQEAVVGTGFPFRRKEALPRYLAVMEAALRRFEDLRRPGAAALDLAWVAAGVFDGFFELGLSPWDVAAGSLLVEEAGGVVSDWSGGDGHLGGDVLAGSPAVHGVLLELARGRPGPTGRPSPASADPEPRRRPGSD